MVTIASRGFCVSLLNLLIGCVAWTPPKDAVAIPALKAAGLTWLDDGTVVTAGPRRLHAIPSDPSRLQRLDFETGALTEVSVGGLGACVRTEDREPTRLPDGRLVPSRSAAIRGCGH